MVHCSAIEVPLIATALPTNGGRSTHLWTANTSESIDTPYDNAPPTKLPAGTLIIIDGEMRLPNIRAAVPALSRD